MFPVVGSTARFVSLTAKLHASEGGYSQSTCLLREAFETRFQFLTAEFVAIGGPLHNITRPRFQRNSGRLSHLSFLHELQPDNVGAGIVAYRVDDRLPYFDHVRIAFREEYRVARCWWDQGYTEWRNDLTSAMRIVQADRIP